MSWIGPPLPNSQNLVLPNQGVSPFRNQMNFAQMKGTVIDRGCPDLDPETAATLINEEVRKIYDRREWSGLFVRGQVATTGFTIGGSVNITQSSNQVVGVGVPWTPAVIGQQFRLGFNTPPYTITGLDQFSQAPNQVLTLEMPWAGVSYSSAGYFIAQYYYALGAGIRYIHTAKNMIMAWRLWLNYNQQTLDSRDPWRATVFTPVALVQMPPDPNGNYMVELWPVPSIVQSLPFIAAIQPPNLVNDSDALPPGIRADVVNKFTIAAAKVYRGPKWNKYYDKAEADRLRGEGEVEMRYMAKADEDLYRQDIIGPAESMDMAPDLLSSYRNAIWDVNHAVRAGEGGWAFDY